MTVRDNDLVLTEAQATTLATHAYVYGYPALLMDRTRASITAVPEAGLHGAPQNQLSHLNAIPDHTFRAVVRPNRDTIYSSAFLDLAQEPMVLTLPDVPDEPAPRFVMFTCLDAWTNAFESPGTRTNDNRASTYVLVRPQHTAPIPASAKVIRAPTDRIWLLGRIELLNEKDLDGVIAVQQGVDLRPLRFYGDPHYTPPTNVSVDPNADRTRDPQTQVLQMTPAAFFGGLSDLIARQTPTGDDEILADLQKIGIRADFDFDSLPRHIRDGLAQGMKLGQELIDFGKRQAGAGGQPWGPSADVPLGDYGTQYLVRAVVAQIGFGANRREDTVYLNTARDAQGNALNGAIASYTLRFEAHALPPVHAFWSLSIYDSDGYFVDNPIHRYLLGSHDTMTIGADGSLEILLQHTPPADPNANWLPVPTGPFAATLRLYWPSNEAVSGSWAAPPLVPPPL